MATKSNVVSGMGVALSLIQTLVASVRKKAAQSGMSEDEADKNLHLLTTPEANGVWDKIASLVLEVGKKVAQVFTLVVDYTRSVKDSIAVGKYDWKDKDKDITDKNFPLAEHEVGTKEQMFTLYHFGKNTQSDWVIAQMAKDGKHPATLRELLAFGEDNPELQREFPIIALGSVWVGRDGGRRVPCLGRDDWRRRLGLGWYGSGWGGDCRFLGVGK